MKKTLLLSTVVLAGAAFAGVTSDNAIAVLDVSVSKTSNNIIAVPFTAYSGEATDQAIKVADLVKTSDLAAGTKLYKVNSGSTYDCWTLSNDKSTWEPAKQVTIDANGAIDETSTDTADTVTIARGEAFWLVPANGSSGSTTIYLMGQKPVSTDAVTASVKSTTANKMSWHLVSLAGVTGMKVTDIAPTKPGAGDMITLVDGTQYKYMRMGWKKYDGKGGYIGNLSDDELTLPAGKGFWYTTTNTTDTVLNLSASAN